MSVAYLPTALGDAGRRPWLLAAGLVLVAAGLYGWVWGMRVRSHRQKDRAALWLAIIGQAAHALMVGVATPGTASRLLPVGIVLIATYALMPDPRVRWSLQGVAVVLMMAPFTAQAAATSEILLVLGLLVAVVYSANAFADDLVQARRAARAARARAQARTTLLFALQDLPTDDVRAAEAAVTALLARQDLDVAVGASDRAAAGAGDDVTGVSTIRHRTEPTTVVVPRRDGNDDVVLMVHRRDGGHLTVNERALVGVAASHLGSVRANTTRVERQHELLRQLTALERTRNSFLATVSDDLLVPLSTVRSTVQRLGEAPKHDTDTVRRVPPATGVVRRPPDPPIELTDLTRAAESLQDTVEAMFALAKAHHVREIERRSASLDAVVDELVARGVAIAGNVAGRPVLADPVLLSHGLRLWAAAPATLHIEHRPDALCLRREQPHDDEVETGLIGRLLVSAGGRWYDRQTLTLPSPGQEWASWQ